MTGHRFCFHGADLIADPSGVLIWGDAGLAIVADLHLEKGSRAASRGYLVPPYDTRTTLDRLEAALLKHRPGRVFCLGDSFHDGEAYGRMAGEDAERVRRLAGSFDWVWIVGNHDPDAPQGMGGRSSPEEAAGPLVFRHEARMGSVGEVSGHLHPIAAVPTGVRRVRGRCFVVGREKMILPAFGAYAGGLDACDPAVSRIVGRPFDVHLLARESVFRFPSHCLGAATIRRGAR